MGSREEKDGKGRGRVSQRFAVPRALMRFFPKLLVGYAQHTEVAVGKSVVSNSQLTCVWYRYCTGEACLHSCRDNFVTLGQLYF